MTSSRLSDADIASVFKVFDATNSNTITQEEMTFALKALGWNRVTEAEVAQVFADLDSTGEKKAMNVLEFTDFVRSKQKGVNSAEEIHAAFRLFDVEGKGKLTRDDLRRAGKAATGRPVADELLDEIMRVADTDVDGELSFEEFGAAVTKGNFEVPDDMKQQKEQKLQQKEAAAAKRAEEGEKEAAKPQDPPVVDVIAGVKVTFFGGLVDRAEVRKALVSFGFDAATLPDASFAELFTDSDADADGKLTRDEYCRLLVGFGEQIDGY